MLKYYLATCDGESGIELNWFATEREAKTAEQDAERLAKDNEYGDSYVVRGEVPNMLSAPVLTADETCLLLNTLQDGYEIALEAYKQDHGRKKDATAIKRLRSKLRKALR